MGDRKLTSEQVWEIRRKYAGGNTCKVLAMEYGVSTATISNYVVGVKREPADRHERVSFGGDPLPSELKGDNATNGAGKQDVSGADKPGGAADKQRGADKPCGSDKAVDTVKDGGAVPAECAGKTENKDMSGADKPGGADGKQDGSGADKSENAAENPGSAAEKLFRGDTKKTGGGGAHQLQKASTNKKRARLSRILKKLFYETGFNQVDLSRFISEKNGVRLSRQAVGHWVRGNSSPNSEYIPLIAEFFGVSVEYLLTDTEDKAVKTDGSGAVRKRGAKNFSKDMSGADGLDACDLATGFFTFIEKNIRGDISINILRRDGIVEIKISSKGEELAFKRRVGGSGGAT